MNIDMYAFTTNGAQLCDVVIRSLRQYNITAYAPKMYADSSEYANEIENTLYESVQKSFKEKDCIIFVGAVGIAVRSIAPFIKSKTTDPAIICADDKGRHVISLLSGHIGGANRLTRMIANVLGGDPVITTATDLNGKFAVDEWAQMNDLYIVNIKSAKDISSHILENNAIGLYSDFQIDGDLPDEIDMSQNKIGICISLGSAKKPFENTLNLIPKILSVGVGCRRNTRCIDIYDAVMEVLEVNNLCHFAIKSLNSIDIKKDEVGIMETAILFKVPFNTYTQEQLMSLKGDFTKSNFVEHTTGVDNVCERASVMGSTDQRLIVRKTIKNSVTVAVCIDDCKVKFSYK